MNHLSRLVLFVVIFLNLQIASAAVPPVVTNWSGFPTVEAACRSVLGWMYGYTHHVLSADGRTASCYSGGYFGGLAHAQAYGCPANSTNSGGSCICDADYVEDETATSCIAKPPPDPCEQLASMCEGSKGFTSQFETPGMNSSLSFLCVKPFTVPAIDPLPGCNKGCIANINGFAEANKTADGQWISKYNATYQSATCSQQSLDDLNSLNDPESTPVDIKDIKQADPVCGGQKGVVNGVSVCLPYNASSGVVSKEEKDNGDGTKTTTKSEVTCENGKCSTTTTSITKNTTTNTTVSSSSSTTTVDKAAYCSQNKTAGVCKDEKGENEDGDGSFGGSCGGGFTCKGDAVMCAMAKEQHKRNCEVLGEDKDPASFFNQVKNGTDSQSAKAMQDNASQINIATQLDKSGYGWSRSCPANTRIDLSFVNGSFEMPFDKLCGPLKIFSDIALAITALSLLVWLVFAGREKAGT